MSKIESFTVGKGRSTKPDADREEWDKKYLELTVRLPDQFTEEGFHKALDNAEHLIDNFLGQVDVASVPDLDLAEINELPWRTFVKGSEPGSVRPKTPGWIFSNEKGAEKLCAAIGKVGSLKLGEFTFKFGGKDDALIQRSKKKAK